jgi:hypothetical protein
MHIHQINIRLSEHEKKTLEKYQLLMQRGQTEVIRELIRSLESKIETMIPSRNGDRS